MDNGVIHELRGINGLLTQIIRVIGKPATAADNTARVQSSLGSSPALSGDTVKAAAPKLPKGEAIKTTAASLATLNAVVRDTASLSRREIRRFRRTMEDLADTLNLFIQNTKKITPAKVKPVTETIKAMSDLQKAIDQAKLDRKKVRNFDGAISQVNSLVSTMMLTAGSILLFGAIVTNEKGRETMVAGLGVFLGLVTSIGIIALVCAGIGLLIKVESAVGIFSLTTFIGLMMGLSLGLVLLGAIIAPGGSGHEYIVGGLAAYLVIMASISTIATEVMVVGEYTKATVLPFKDMAIFIATCMGVCLSAVALGALVLRFPYETTVGLAAFAAMLSAMTFIATRVVAKHGTVKKANMGPIKDYAIFALLCGGVLAEIVAIGGMVQHFGIQWQNIILTVIQMGVVIGEIELLAWAVGKLKITPAMLIKMRTIELLAAGAAAVVGAIAAISVLVSRSDAGWKGVNIAMGEMALLMIGVGAFAIALGYLMVPPVSIALAAGGGVLLSLCGIMAALSLTIISVAVTMKKVSEIGGWNVLTDSKTGFFAGATLMIDKTLEFLSTSFSRKVSVKEVAKGMLTLALVKPLIDSIASMMGNVKKVSKGFTKMTEQVSALPKPELLMNVANQMAKAISGFITNLRDGLVGVGLENKSGIRKGIKLRQTKRDMNKMEQIFDMFGSIIEPISSFAEMLEKYQDGGTDTLTIFTGEYYEDGRPKTRTINIVNSANVIAGAVNTFFNTLAPNIAEWRKKLFGDSGGTRREIKNRQKELTSVCDVFGSILQPVSDFAEMLSNYEGEGDVLNIFTGEFDSKNKAVYREVNVKKSSEAIVNAVNTFFTQLTTLFTDEFRQKIMNNKKDFEDLAAVSGHIGSAVDTLNSSLGSTQFETTLKNAENLIKVVDKTHSSLQTLDQDLKSDKHRDRIAGLTGLSEAFRSIKENGEGAADAVEKYNDAVSKMNTPETAPAAIEQTGETVKTSGLFGKKSGALPKEISLTKETLEDMQALIAQAVAAALDGLAINGGTVTESRSGSRTGYNVEFDFSCEAPK